MRIDRIRLPRFRNLINFGIDFDQNSSRQVVVGRNGVGKSNLLEAIARIFRDLDLGEPTDFAYEIEYLCRGNAVRIKNTAEWSSSARTTKTRRFSRTYEVAPISGANLFEDRAYEPVSESEFNKRNQNLDAATGPTRLLPNYVFGYYSGDLARFQKIFDKHESRYYSSQIKGTEAPLRALFLAKPHHSQFAFLSFFASEDELARKFLKEEMRIDGLVAVLFALREPYWHKGRRGTSPVGGDLRFWGAGGKVAPFLEALFEQSFVPMAFEQKLRVSVGQNETKERRFLYVPNHEALIKLADGLSNKEFFARLESLVFSNLVALDGSDVRIWLDLQGSDEPATFADLAEGERQLLTVLGLLRFTAQDEALFLLDEPDTHLNPAWCLDYLENLRKYGTGEELTTSQIIMTTHSPLTFAGLEKTEVVVMERGADGRIYAEHPLSSPRGMGFQAILTSDFFKLRTTLDKETLGLLDEKRELALKEEKSDADRARLAELDEELGRLDFSHAARDPLYLEFIRAMTQAQEEQPRIAAAVPAEKDWRIRKEVAAEVAKRIAEKARER
jgi:predicted ATPase